MGTGLPSPSPVTTQQRPMAARNSRLPEGSWTGRQDRSLKEGGSALPPSWTGRCRCSIAPGLRLRDRVGLRQGPWTQRAGSRNQCWPGSLPLQVQAPKMGEAAAAGPGATLKRAAARALGGRDPGARPREAGQAHTPGPLGREAAEEAGTAGGGAATPPGAAEERSAQRPGPLSLLGKKLFLRSFYFSRWDRPVHTFKLFLMSWKVPNSVLGYLFFPVQHLSSTNPFLDSFSFTQRNQGYREILQRNQSRGRPSLSSFIPTVQWRPLATADGRPQRRAWIPERTFLESVHGPWGQGPWRGQPCCADLTT